MTTLIDIKMPLIVNVTLSDDTIEVELNDGRSIAAPISWYPRLQLGSKEERKAWRLIASGQGIHWDMLDEDISVEGLISGTPSMEKSSSLNRWIERRKSA